MAEQIKVYEEKKSSSLLLWLIPLLLILLGLLAGYFTHDRHTAVPAASSCAAIVSRSFTRKLIIHCFVGSPK